MAFTSRPLKTPSPGPPLLRRIRGRVATLCGATRLLVGLRRGPRRGRAKKRPMRVGGRLTVSGILPLRHEPSRREIAKELFWLRCPLGVRTTKGGLEETHWFSMRKNLVCRKSHPFYVSLWFCEAKPPQKQNEQEKEYFTYHYKLVRRSVYVNNILQVFAKNG